ncbi:hypothetical protein GGR51DRAFT_230839 [Nemania sp. FL0031]|nr:hypothetical protein GGR51DRAFT_230839 [Nemania sp. FL0031]
MNHSPNDSLGNNRQDIYATESLGVLNTLPPEILTDIIIRLDIPSLAIFRRVNRCAMATVDSIPQYHEVYHYYPNVLRAIVRREARHFDLETLWRTLYKTRCFTCGCEDLTYYIYLITCIRVCWACFTRNKSLLPMTEKHACMATGRSRKELEQLPHIRGVFRKYGNDGKLSFEQLTLWDRRAVLSIQKAEPTREKRDYRANDPRRLMAFEFAGRVPRR